jgi:two-component system alkaline phosphatase synthesis response regulator PhoP
MSDVTGRILVIDDETALRQSFTRILQKEGHDVTTAANGEEGIALVSEHPFDLVYLDIRMPDMNGLDVLKAIHEKFPELPVILFTAQPDLNSALDALRRGAKDYLLKPLKPQVLIEHTKTVLADQQKERRKRELQQKIDALQSELAALENDSPKQQESSPDANISDDRFLKRGNLTLDLLARRLTVNGEPAELPPTSFDYLLALARHAPNVVNYQTMVSEAQGYETDAHEAQELTKWHVHNIRQAIEPDPRKPSYVINVRGTGYRLVAD